nr:pleiotropic drug resistance protein 1-like isoform X1 [Physcomitrium patens]XP_024402509.1 pleiotropic drug resistance protein 1-like isoform X1 [Physcomitrium patens]XP_024402510.1 pleiotropic drug resistance protein 1-like isoform X1 [Physcomitrium patens]XP_024402511.1 pleiotropic drug resistance protein 1-like isoform X1 [Physcomitrium patens]XP_024402512.1 pleiotropic drug resistance protein 1-like isoform X1 [Physcomitrium patens]XP_024402513.1 pleiotropic drug resistance protein 1-li|eukprot:XP_024402508.1 pleiotropic drug resistance protein 1-like isoform X1 [Physcomitrella patens]
MASEKVQQAVGNIRLQLERPLEQAPPETANIFDNEYVQDGYTSIKVVMRRQFTLTLRSKSFLYARMIQLAILGIFTGTLFYQVPTTSDRADMDLRKSLAFLAAMTLSLNSISQIPVQLDERTVFEKQYSARFFRPYAYLLACTLSQIPLTLVEMVIYTPLVYFLTGLTLANNGAHYITYAIAAFLCANTFAMFTRFAASLCHTKESASGISGLCITFFLLFSGFLIAKNKVPDWWIWVYYISPLQWAITALICNEFLSDTYSQPCNNSITYCRGRSDMNIGQAYLAIYDFPTTTLRGYWVPVLVLFFYYWVLSCCCFWTVANVRHEEVKLPSIARLLRNQTAISKPLEGKTKFRFSRIFKSVQNANNDVGIKFEPAMLSFHQIVYEIKIPGIKDPRVLLSNVSGFSKPGTMTALMGSSGAGKTTLLDVLAGRKTTGRILGDILANGYPKEQETFARITGYVEQNDIHTPFITVRESFQFSGSLRLPRGTSAGARQKFIEEVLKLLELNEIEDKIVGAIGDGGLSVEEAKRLTIGVELVANPSILFLDEPTSGLDSRAAQVVMRSITNIVESGRSVICTIHQPSRRLFFCFSHLMLLKRGGEIAYFGPIGEQARDLLEYFHSRPGVSECSADQNPASYMLEIIGAGIGHTAERDFARDYQQSSLAQQYRIFIKNLKELETYKFGRGKFGLEPIIKGYGATYWQLCKIVTVRQFRTYWRNISYSFGRMMLMIVLGLILGTTYYQIKYDNIAGMSSRMGLIYIGVIMVGLTNANNVIPQVNAERVVYYRERASNMYPVLFYSMSWTLAEIPYLCISSLLFCSICFSLGGVATDSAKISFEFWIILCEYTACITFFGIFLAMMTPNAQVATLIIPVVVNIWNMTSGFMIPKKKIPSFWMWLYWINPTQFTLNSLAAIAFHCDLDNPPCDTCTLLPTSCPECPCVRVQDQDNMLAWYIMKDSMSLDYTKRYENMGVLLMFNLFFMIASVFALKCMKFDRR